MKNALVFTNFQRGTSTWDEESAFRTRAFTSQSAITGPCALIENCRYIWQGQDSRNTLSRGPASGESLLAH